jgi:hypothetical protein
MMFLSVSIPIIIIGITGQSFPEKPTQLAYSTFDAIDTLKQGDKVMLSFDFDPASEGELGPMATAFTYHCAAKGLKMYFMALWPVGPQMIDNAIENVIKKDFPDMVYGKDYVNLGFKSGGEGVIKVIVTDFLELFSTDAKGTPFNDIPMNKEISSVQDMDLVINISAGSAGTKEWVQYAVTPYPDEITLVAGCTGVQAPLLYPYIPEQLPGLLGAIKGAAEYEKLVFDKYYRDEGKVVPGRYQEGVRRMGPQLVAHLLMILLIIAGNFIYFVEKKRGVQ